MACSGGQEYGETGMETSSMQELMHRMVTWVCGTCLLALKRRAWLYLSGGVYVMCHRDAEVGSLMHSQTTHL